MATKQQTFEVFIESYKVFNLGEEVSFRLCLTNVTKQDYFILTWNTPFQGLDSNQFKILFKNETIRYDGLKIKRLDPTHQNYILIKAGQTKRISVNINESYYLDKPGTYSAFLMTRILDHFETSKGTLDTVPLRQDFHCIEIVSNEIQFELIEDSLPLIPFGIKEKIRKLQSKDSLPITPVFIGGTEELRSITLESHFAANQMSKISLYGLGTLPDLHYFEWFGINDNAVPTRFQRVCDNYDHMNRVMEGPIIYNFTDPYKVCTPGKLAYTFFGSDTIYLCGAFAQLPITDTDTKPGIILHEYTHKSFDTENIKYGMKNCLHLALTIPDSAIKNADNYQYFSETSVTGGQKLYAFHQGCKDNKEMWVSILEDSAWYPDYHIKNIGITSSPSVVLFMGRLYIFHNGFNETELWYFTYDGANWSHNTKVSNVGINSNPGAVVYKGSIYVFHRGAGSELWYSTFDGNTWAKDVKVSQVAMTDSPSAAVYNDMLYIFHQGSNDNGELWYSVYDGNCWFQDTRIPNAHMSWSPAAIYFENKLFVFFQGPGSNNELWYCSFNGQYWDFIKHVQNVGISKSPTACVYKNFLYCFHEGVGNSGELCFSKFDGLSWIKGAVMKNITTGSAGVTTAIFFSKF